jgi:hypothetical protein
MRSLTFDVSPGCPMEQLQNDRTTLSVGLFGNSLRAHPPYVAVSARIGAISQQSRLLSTPKKAAIEKAAFVNQPISLSSPHFPMMSRATSDRVLGSRFLARVVSF